MLLLPVAQVIYTVPPERGRDDRCGGVVALEWIAAGSRSVYGEIPFPARRWRGSFAR